jgi:hypothetical protein
MFSSQLDGCALKPGESWISALAVSLGPEEWADSGRWTWFSSVEDAKPGSAVSEACDYGTLCGA